METSRRFHRRAYRLVAIAMDQVRSLRARMLVDYFNRNPGSGAYVKIGASRPKIVREAGKDARAFCDCRPATLNDDQIKQAASFKDTLRTLLPEEFELLARHGWEAADGTLCSRFADSFSHKEYKRSV
ncbi:MAG: hypothetical protein GF363_16760 [Chitinivibrionales bacterium]|nr:hypothetical protein [Chitinivibrionales bacterium]